VLKVQVCTVAYVTVIYVPAPFFDFSRTFFHPDRGFVRTLSCWGLVLRLFLPIGDQNPEESVISPQTRFVDLFTTITRLLKKESPEGSSVMDLHHSSVEKI